MKDIRLEWRNKYAFNGMLLYVVGAIFICYMSFNVKKNILHAVIWNALFWIIHLFAAINATTKSFVGEREGRNLYYFFTVDPVALIFSKIFYNTLLLLLINTLGYMLYTMVLGNPVADVGAFMLALLLGATSFGAVLSLVSAIAGKAGNSATLMAVLSFPLLIPMLLLIIKICKNAIDGIDFNESFDELGILLGLNAVVWALAYILFPFIWKN